ncbi:MAG TPA: chemotaxis protein, partial [Stellaceae bacterium]|nr:chemotaxis protein [Stellaceae bacterium]
VGSNVSDTEWFRAGMATASGDDFAAIDIDTVSALRNAQVATYATAVRAGGVAHGAKLGVLGVFFDWQPQAATVTGGVRLSNEEKQRTRCLLLDSRHRVIAASDGRGVLSETWPLAPRGNMQAGHYSDDTGTMVGYALTPGYETYRGLGWYGVIVQRPPALQARAA